MTRPIGTAAELERRRRRAVDLVDHGEAPSTVARILGVHPTSLHRWCRLARAESGLDAKPHRGPRPRLSDEQLAQLDQLLVQGPLHHGWPNQLWTADRVTAIIERHFGLKFHPEHVRNMLKQRLGWTSQKPQIRAKENNDQEVERWLTEEFPRILREARERDATLLFIDESGFLLTPTVRRTLAPRGKTPVLPAWQRHDRISAISGIALSSQAQQPELYFELLPEGLNVSAEEIVAFLKDVRREVPGPLTVLWDRHNIHSRSRRVQEWLALQEGVVLEDLPSYAPKLNPVEMVWAWLKYGRLSNLTPSEVRELRDHVLTEMEWAAFDRELLSGFINHAHLGLTL